MSSDPFSDRRPDDRELDDFLAGRHPLSRAYRDAAQSESAPAELDAGILAAAREAARVPVARRRPRWLQPMAFAATLALGVAVLLQLRHEPAVKAPLDLPARSQPFSEEIDSSARELTAPSPLEAQGDAAMADTGTMAKPSAPAPGGPPPAAKSEALSEESRRARSGIADLSRERPAASVMERAPAPQSLPQPPPPPPITAVPESAQRRAVVPAEPAAAAAEASKESEALDSQKPLQAGAAGAERAPEPFPHAQADATVAETESGQAMSAATSPQAWFDQIRERRRAGDEVGAAALFDSFRKAYPDVRLPEDLADLERVVPE